MNCQLRHNLRILLLCLSMLAAGCAPSGDLADQAPPPPADAKGGEECVISPPGETIYCTQQYEPVCGCNGKTYGNACTARAAGVSQYEPGRCEDGAPEA